MRPNLILVAALALLIIPSLTNGQCTVAWQPGFSGAVEGDTLSASIVFDDGTGPHLYVAGILGVSTAGPVAAVSRFDGTSWTALGGPASVDGFAVWDDGTGPALYATGSFAGAFGVRRLVGSTWVAVGAGGFGSAPTSLAVFDSDAAGPLPPTLHVGGTFGVMKLSAGAWVSIGSIFTSGGSTLALCTYDSDGAGPIAPLLIAGGYFSSMGGVAVNSIAAWNGVAWSALGSGATNFVSPAGFTPGTVRTLAALDFGAGPLLHVGGTFQFANFLMATNAAQWNGTNWNSIGDFGGPGAPTVRAFAAYDDGGGTKLYVGGTFTNGGSALARKDPFGWAAVGGGLASGFNPAPEVWTLASYDADGGGPGQAVLFVGGRFMIAGSTGADCAAAWNGTAWTPVGVSGSIAGNVNCMARFDDGTGPALYVGGTFIVAGSVIANRIARFDGSQWSALGPGMNGGVYALTVYDDGTGPQLYAGGAFTAAPGQPGNGIARWNGSTWSDVGGGVAGTSAAVCSFLAFDDGTGTALYAGGRFTTAGGVPANHIARWNGVAWSQVGTSGVTPAAQTEGAFPPGFVLALAPFDSDGAGPLPPVLVAGGRFSSASGTAAANVAQWNGAAWAALDGGLVGSFVGGTVGALQPADIGGVHALYASGRFTSSSGVSLNAIAKWGVGLGWSDVGGMLGSFQSPAQMPLGLALAVFDDGSGPGLYVAGQFGSAGGVPALHAARWNGASWSALGSGFTELVFMFVKCLLPLPSSGGLLAGGQFATAGGLPSSNLALWRSSAPAISFSQPGGPGSGCFVENSNLQPLGEYFDVFSLEPCPMLGGGPYLGLCSSDPTVLLAQFQLPLGAAPFHFTAPAPTASFGPFLLPPGLVADAISFSLALPGLCVSSAGRLVVQ